MAPDVVDVIIGVDVCKDRLDLFEYHSERSYWISNDAAAIKAWLDGFAGRLKLALEPTNRYHLGLAEAAYARGHEVYLIDPYRLSHYRAGLGRRAKTDAQDAQLLARFLERELGELRPWEPMIPGQQRFWQLLKRRASLVRCKVQLNRKRHAIWHDAYHSPLLTVWLWHKNLGLFQPVEPPFGRHVRFLEDWPCPTARNKFFAMYRRQVNEPPRVMCGGEAVGLSDTDDPLHPGAQRSVGPRA
jgi:transposase